MRQWLVNPEFMCRKHLLGEHVEHHMLVGTLRQKKSINGYIEKNCLEPLSIYTRHEQLVNEIQKRKYNHKSPLQSVDINYLPDKIKNYRINKAQSLSDLLSRCPECRKRFNEYHKQYTV